jgi:hypothetical protein
MEKAAAAADCFSRRRVAGRRRFPNPDFIAALGQSA